MIIKIVIKFYAKYHQRLRIILFRYLSNNINVEGVPNVITPTLLLGKGKIVFGKKVTLGYFPSPFFYDGTIHIDSRSNTSQVYIGSNVFINNNFHLTCDKSVITISDNVLIGTNVEIIDSDFHEIDPDKRNSGNHICSSVFIGKNVFIGSNSKIMKGVTIGENSIIANGSIVTKDVPKNVIVGGNPIKIIKEIKHDEK